MTILLHRRSALIGGLGAGLLLPQRAQADSLFTNFAFPATGAPTLRTMPVRLAEIKNVKDFGAIGDGITNDTAAIQAAVNWTAGANRGTIYFPIGSYVVSSPITLNYNGALNIRLLGEIGVLISGDVNGYIFDRALGTPSNTAFIIFERLSISNSHAGSGGAIRLGSTIGGAIRDCKLTGFIGFTSEDAVGVSSKNINIENCVFSSTFSTGATFIIIGGGGSISGCTLSNTDIAVRAYGSGLSIFGNRSERCNTSFLLGLDSGGNNVGLSGFSLMSTTTEGCWTAYDLAGLCEAFVISSVTSLGHDASNSGTPGGVQGSQYGVRIRANCAKNGVIQGVSINSYFDQTCISVADATSRANLVIRDVTALQTGGAGVNWITPSNAYTAQFINNNVDPIWTFSQLPTGGNLFEGDEFNISDSTTATWGANVTTGGGSNRVLVRYNGTNWTVVGK